MTHDTQQDKHIVERPELFIQADSVRPGVSLCSRVHPLALACSLSLCVCIVGMWTELCGR